MLFIIKLTTFLCVSLGIYTIFKEKLKFATHKTTKVAKVCIQQDNNVNPIELLLESVATKISPYIKLDNYKRKKMEADLRSLNIAKTPEIYQAYAIAKSGMILLGLIPCLIFLPILSVVVVAFALATYFRSENDLKEELRKKKEDIEFELPRFACTLKQELSSSRDVLTILENYKKNAGISMKKELEVTIADMRSGNYESALLRFESRISSTSLSDIIRGLMGVLRGDNNVNYFEMLSHDLDVLEVQRLENIAMKQPGKIKKYLFLLLVCTLIMYVTILAVYTVVMVGR